MRVEDSRYGVIGFSQRPRVVIDGEDSAQPNLLHIQMPAVTRDDWPSPLSFAALVPVVCRYCPRSRAWAVASRKMPEIASTAATSTAVPVGKRKTRFASSLHFGNIKWAW